MPTYDYICKDCGYEFELFQTITARAVRKCPGCGKMALKRLIGAGSGVIFKGSGFYQTDYRSEGYKKAEKSEKAGTRKKETKTTTKSKDSKSSDKTEPETKNKNTQYPLREKSA